MDSVPGNSPLPTLGKRIREARQAQGLSQEALAGVNFTKGYVSALERGAVRPSLKALEIFAQRLQIPISELLATPGEPESEPDINALQEDLHYQLNYANMLIHNNQVPEALELIDVAEATISPYSDQLSISSQYRPGYLRGMAFIQSRETDRARTELEAALKFVEGIEVEEEAAARIRNLLGVVFSLQGQLRMALEQHLLCLHAVTGRRVKDPNLQLSIYRNLANDYWALNEFTQAIGIYREALRLLDDYNDLDRQAQIYWGLAAAYKAAGDWPHAKLYATKALHIYEAESNYSSAATVSMNLAELLIKDNQYAEAEHLLDRAKVFLESASDQMLLANLYQAYGELARRKGQLERAATYAAKSIELGEALYRQASEGGLKASGYPIRTYAVALHTAALVEEEQGHIEQADQFFRQALEVVGHTDYQELLDRIAFSYGEVLKERGDYAQAMEYFRIAAESRIRFGL